MPDIEYILSRIRDRYDGVEELSSDLPCDYIVYTKNRRDSFYIIMSTTELIPAETKARMSRFMDCVRNRTMNMKPIIVFLQEDYNLMFGILVYWDDSKAFLNTDIHWMDWKAENELWLDIQIHARRMQLDYLPIDYLRVIKTIHLNDKDISDGKLIYLRKFTPEYKMQTPPAQNEQERLNRLFEGTPESEYPADMLDDLLYSRIKELYPLATMQSQLLLFHTDLLNLRKNKECVRKPISLCFKLLNENLALDGTQKNILLEYYYRPNIFKHQSYIHDIDSLVPIQKEDMFMALIKKANTYEPLSTMMI